MARDASKRPPRRTATDAPIPGSANPVDVSDDEDLQTPFEARLSQARGRSDSADAFFPDPGDGPARVPDDLAEFLAEDFVKSATTGEDSEDNDMEAVVPEELGGPFIETTGNEEFARGTDDSNPEDATQEPLPRAVHGLIGEPPTR